MKLILASKTLKAADMNITRKYVLYYIINVVIFSFLNLILYYMNYHPPKANLRVEIENSFIKIFKISSLLVLV